MSTVSLNRLGARWDRIANRFPMPSRRRVTHSLNTSLSWANVLHKRTILSAASIPKRRSWLACSKIRERPGSASRYLSMTMIFVPKHKASRYLTGFTNPCAIAAMCLSAPAPRPLSLLQIRLSGCSKAREKTMAIQTAFSFLPVEAEEMALVQAPERRLCRRAWQSNMAFR